LFKPAIDCFKARGGSMTIEEMEEAMAAAMRLSDELLAVPHGDGPGSQFDYELAWVRTYLKKGGALENSERGVWRLTPLGAAMTDAEIRSIPKRVRDEARLRRSGDGGIDGTGVLRVNLLSFHVLFQSKRFKGSVGAPVVRDFRGAMVGRADKGLIITTGTFTPEARREATRDGAPAIDLVDGDGLCDLLKLHKIGLNVRLVEEVEVDPDYFKNL
jgi:restriction system protein